MGKIVHTSRITITRVGGPTRKAVIEGFEEPIFYGVHGGIKQFYGVEPKEEHPATLDHIIGGVGGWMMGTLAQFLAKKDIPTTEDRYVAHVEGDIEDVNGVLKITRIKVTYSLKIPPAKRDDARQAFEQYLPYCPGAQSVIDAIHIEHDLKIEEDKGN